MSLIDWVKDGVSSILEGLDQLFLGMGLLLQGALKIAAAGLVLFLGYLLIRGFIESPVQVISGLLRIATVIGILFGIPIAVGLTFPELGMIGALIAWCSACYLAYQVGVNWPGTKDDENLQ